MVGVVVDSTAVSCCVHEFIYGACVHMFRPWTVGGTLPATIIRDTRGYGSGPLPRSRVIARSPLLTPRPILDLGGLCMSVQVFYYRVDIVQFTLILTVNIVKRANSTFADARD